MPNLRDKELDDLSREAADHHELGNIPPSWDKLSKRLDEELPQKDRDRKPIIFLFLLIGLLAGGAYLLIPGKKGTGVDLKTKSTGTAPVSTNEKGNREEEETLVVVDDRSSTDVKQPEKADGSVANSLANTPAEASADNSKAVRKGMASDQRVTTRKNKPSNRIAVIEKDPARYRSSKNRSATIPSERDAKIKELTADKRKNQRTGSKKTDDVIRSDEPTNDESKKTAKIEKDKKATAALPPQIEKDTKADEEDKNPSKDITDAQPLNQDSASAKLTVKPQPQTTSEPVNKAAEKTVLQAKKGEGSTLSPFSVALQLGTDISTVKFTHSDNAGYTIGMLGGYRFNKNWSVYTGLNYTRKNYTLNGSDYHPPKGTWAANYKVDKVDGYCEMFEWPILARYSFNKPGRNRLFASTGLSTYFMQKEHYYYSYRVMGNPYRRNWKYDGNDNYWLSILHLSAGFEQPLTKNLSWVIEPYAKLPLGGVGYGNIKLSSYGVSMFLQFRPNKK